MPKLTCKHVGGGDQPEGRVVITANNSIVENALLTTSSPATKIVGSDDKTASAIVTNMNDPPPQNTLNRQTHDPASTDPEPAVTKLTFPTLSKRTTSKGTNSKSVPLSYELRQRLINTDPNSFVADKLAVVTKSVEGTIVEVPLSIYDTTFTQILGTTLFLTVTIDEVFDGVADATKLRLSFWKCKTRNIETVDDDFEYYLDDVDDAPAVDADAAAVVDVVEFDITHKIGGGYDGIMVEYAYACIDIPEDIKSKLNDYVVNVKKPLLDETNPEDLREKPPQLHLQFKKSMFDKMDKQDKLKETDTILIINNTIETNFTIIPSESSQYL